MPRVVDKPHEGEDLIDDGDVDELKDKVKQINKIEVKEDTSTKASP